MRFLFLTALLGLTASASTVTGFVSYSSFDGSPFSSMSFSNGSYTISHSTQYFAYTAAPTCPFGGTPCLYDPSLSRSDLVYRQTESTIRDGSGALIDQTGFVTLLQYSFSGAPFLVQPTPAVGPFPGNADIYSTSDVPLFFQGTIDMRRNGICIWCETFVGSALSSSTFRGGPTGSNVRNMTFAATGTATPEPGTWALVGLGGLGAALVRRRRQQRK